MIYGRKVPLSLSPLPSPIFIFPLLSLSSSFLPSSIFTSFVSSIQTPTSPHTTSYYHKLPILPPSPGPRSLLPSGTLQDTFGDGEEGFNLIRSDCFGGCGWFGWFGWFDYLADAMGMGVSCVLRTTQCTTCSLSLSLGISKVRHLESDFRCCWLAVWLAATPSRLSCFPEE